MVVPAAPGGILDQAARSLARSLQEELKTPVIVDNRAGAGGRIGAQSVARAPADGYTLLLITNGTLTYTPATESNLGFDPHKDLTALSQVASYGLLMVVNPSVPAKTVQEFIAYARSHPGINYGSSGSASGLHFAGELFRSMADVQLTHIPYKGSAPAIQDLLANQVQLMFAPGEAMAQIEAGKLRVLAVTTLDRDPRLPGIPTLSESGLKGYDIPAWMGLFGPPGLPAAVRDRLLAALQRTLTTTDVRKQFNALGMTVVGSTPQQLDALMLTEAARLKDVATRLHITPDK